MSDTLQEHSYDVAIVGGGLAGGLIALAINRARPEFRLALIENGTSLGGNHRWSWFASDLSSEGTQLLDAFRKSEWDAGYQVAFPSHSRVLRAGYRSMSSRDFHAALTRQLPESALHLGRAANAVDARGVDLDNGTRINARTVIDCRTAQPSDFLCGGWQVFMGRHMRLPQPHGLGRPMIMDATVDQLAPRGNGGAYRFVYVLPLSAHDVFVEDTYYADDPVFDRSALSSRIDQYSHEHGWGDAEIIGHETGVLPVLTGGDFTAYQREISIPGVVIAGARGGFSHPLTSYTLPIAVSTALAIAENCDLTGPQLAALVESRARSHWRRTGFYRKLARMLFFAAEPKARVRVFERFYRLGEGLIERFYSGQSTLSDRARILAGKPPVSIPRAIAALFNRGPSLKSEKTA